MYINHTIIFMFLFRILFPKSLVRLFRMLFCSVHELYQAVKGLQYTDVSSRDSINLASLVQGNVRFTCSQETWYNSRVVCKLRTICRATHMRKVLESVNFGMSCTVCIHMHTCSYLCLFIIFNGVPHFSPMQCNIIFNLHISNVCT